MLLWPDENIYEKELKLRNSGQHFEVHSYDHL